jgi:photosystem II stability/assembly factor-like uncharacterized protein
VAASTGAGNDEGASGPAGGPAGLYTSTDGGQTWTLSFQGMASGIGATSVIYDAASHKFFAFLQFQGYYSSRDGLAWTRLANQPGTALLNCQTDSTGNQVCYAFRGEMAVVPGREELYTWYVTIDQQGNIGDGGIYKTTNGGSSWQQVDDAGITNCGDGNGNGCGVEQGWFNLTLAAVPNGNGTDLYAGTVNLYKCSITGSNSLCGTSPFINLTHVYGCSPLGSLAHVHPDQHGISFLRLNPSQVIMYFANDGGIYRALNGYALRSGTCGTASNPFQNLNGTMGSMSEFVDFSNSPGDSATLLGGTQDNGSPATDAGHGASWISVNGGDGGFNVIDPNSADLWFTSNTDVSVQRCNDGINCLAQTFDPIVTNTTVGGDHGFFYTPFLLDPQADSRMLVGTCRVWRGNSDGSGFVALSYNLETVMDQGLNQPCSGGETQLIRAIAAGGPATAQGSSVIYVGTEGGYTSNSPNPLPGQIWVSNDADLGPSTWGSFFAQNFGAYAVSSIAVDATDPTGNTAYATVMGFTSASVVQTTDQGGTWTPLTNNAAGVNSQLPTAPANTILIDPDDNHTLYVGTDVGVFTTHDLKNWTELGQLPNVPVLQLKMFEAGGVKQLRAGTYGRGVWSYDIPYQIRITTPHVYLFPGQSGTINGVITGYNGYTSPVDIQCTGNLGFGTCQGTTVTPMPSGTPFSLTVAVGTTSQAMDYNIVVQGTGTDPNSTMESAAAIVTPVDYSIELNSSSVSVNQGGSSAGDSLVLMTSSFYEDINFSCSGLPMGASCNFYPSATVPPFSFNPVAPTLTVSAAADTPTGTYSAQVVAEAAGQPSPKTLSFSLVVGSSPDYALTATAPATPVVPGGSVSAALTLTPAGAYTGPVTLSCSVPNNLITCSLSPSGAITLAGSPVTVTATLSVQPDSGIPPPTGVQTVTFSAAAPSVATHYAAVNLSVTDFSLAARSSSTAANAGQSGQYELVLNGAGVPFSNTVSFSCSGLPAGSACSFSPATVVPGAGPAYVIMSVSTAKSTAGLRAPAPAGKGEFLLALLLPGIVVSLGGGLRRKPALFAALLVMVLGVVILQAACGGGGSSVPAPPPQPTPTPAGPPPPVTYNFNVVANSGALQHQLPLTLIVQPQ